ncbi:glycoside hydrolase family 31 protein [Mucilaginibacter roseus]|uniref:Glycoside hydrolase family 31 protein n=1 Tax=Mucilaginibacter roseus TaxID=1528868 RepID=A0ABS8U3Y0_9SPHI|nr:glycoside hydrolase family 31 protein [Mucilaginibacter roseus]MCD8740810.1 glycoside hydrolase family 31 protein [Mucilaginibacter roseus]
MTNNYLSTHLKKSWNKLLVAIPFLLSFNAAFAQNTNIAIKPGEYWYGGAVNEAQTMPFKDGYTFDLFANTGTNQASPLLLSTKGRYVWSDEPFKFTVRSNQLVITGNNQPLDIDSAGHNLKESFINASKKHFAAKGKLPDTLLFSRPQYNTWIELVYNQNQTDILKYAHDVVANDFPAGVLMIDDNWADYYGRFDFRKDRFSNATAMVDSLHKMGFKVMLWISPFVSPDTEVFRELLSKKLLLYSAQQKEKNDWDKAINPAIISWWNGYSAVLDFTNPKAQEWFKARLNYMVNTYHLDGFKFDAGDADFYPADAISYKKATPNEHSRLWGEIGLNYPLNEYRAMWKMAGKPLVQRLRDKQHTWADLQKLIPHITVAGLLGYNFTCPDMIGGGEYGSFIGRDKLDEELVVRSAQCSALMPMMQFSVAPWRVLSKEHLALVKQAVETRKKHTPYIMQLAKSSAKTGLPIVRSMEYQYPAQGYAEVKSQFMLGDKLLIAPALNKDKTKTIYLPKGKWRDDRGKTIKGPAKIEQDVPLNRLPVFELVSK